MDATTQEESRIRQRFDVNLKATGRFEGNEATEHQIRIVNLSSSGARLHFETSAHISVGMHIKLKIAIPNTILNIPAMGEIVWVTRKDSTVLCGFRFQDIISETMVRQLIREN